MLRVVDGHSYEVYSDGRVFSYDTKRFLKPYLNEKGYLRVRLGGKYGKHYFVHRLVAEAYLPNPYSLPQVNHKDEDKTNNCMENLEWCTNEYNYSYGTRIDRVSRANRKPLMNVTTGQCWSSIRECAKCMGVTPQTIGYWIRKGRYKYI